MDSYKIITSKYFHLLVVLIASIIVIENWILGLIVNAIFVISLERRWKFVIIALKTLPRDIKIIAAYCQYIYQIERWKLKGWTTAQVFLENVKKHPRKIAFIHEETQWSFRQVEDYSNRVANYFKSQGFKRGDTIALFMESRPQYVGIWLGLSKIGVVCAFVNTQQRQTVLRHSLDIIDCKSIIIGNELKPYFHEILNAVPDWKIFFSGSKKSVIELTGSVDLDVELPQMSIDPLPEEIARCKMTDVLCYIYTSGTTGLPKAAIITHCKFMFMVCSSCKVLRFEEDDILYEPLPLYHAAGGLLGVGQALLCGLTVVTKVKFSASKFWSDCIKYNCTIAHYIGDLCRYLLAQPEKPEEHQHKVRIMFGNGLRPQIWKSFAKRFNIKQIGELYAATEGNANLMNADNKVGAVGYVPWFVAPFYPVALLRADSETNEPIRGENGFCIKCKTGEPGILVGEISKKRPSSHYYGYSDKTSSDKKVIHNVFRKGDKFFNSGDVLVCDEYGYFYFKDRTGDTYRWRGENVATLEVEAIISSSVGLKDVVVYGVEIPDIDGKAGMAAIVDEKRQLNLVQFYEGIKNSLPTYARPVFLRIIDHAPMTETFKLKKLHLQSEGYNPSSISDPLYFMDHREDKYIPITEELYQQIILGKIRL